jgi:hypothetical protein
MSHTHQVVIVGGGPVGLGLAIELGQRGIKCCVVERYTKLLHIPKGQNLTQRTLEHVRHWGAEQPLRAARTIPTSYGIGGLTAYGSLIGDYHLRLAAAGIGAAVLRRRQRTPASV